MIVMGHCSQVALADSYAWNNIITLGRSIFIRRKETAELGRQRSFIVWFQSSVRERVILNDIACILGETAPLEAVSGAVLLLTREKEWLNESAI